MVQEFSLCLSFIVIPSYFCGGLLLRKIWRLHHQSMTRFLRSDLCVQNCASLKIWGRQLVTFLDDRDGLWRETVRSTVLQKWPSFGNLSSGNNFPSERRNSNRQRAPNQVEMRHLKIKFPRLKKNIETRTIRPKLKGGPRKGSLSAHSFKIFAWPHFSKWPISPLWPWKIVSR